MAKYKRQPNEVVITVSGGVATLHSRPRNVKVTIVDFDNGDSEEDDRLEEFEGEKALIDRYEDAT